MESLPLGLRRVTARYGFMVWMSRNARSATDFFRIPPSRVVELGAQIEL